MSDYEPQVGDRVRVVLEGVVRGRDEDGVFEVGDPGLLLTGNSIDPGEPHVVSIERLPDPLPTTPGSVVEDTFKRRWARADTPLAVWMRLDWPGETASYEYLHTCGPLTVLFDAGAKP